MTIVIETQRKIMGQKHLWWKQRVRNESKWIDHKNSDWKDIENINQNVLMDNKDEVSDPNQGIIIGTTTSQIFRQELIHFVKIKSSCKNN